MFLKVPWHCIVCHCRCDCVQTSSLLACVEAPPPLQGITEQIRALKAGSASSSGQDVQQQEQQPDISVALLTAAVSTIAPRKQAAAPLRRGFFDAKPQKRPAAKVIA